MFEYCRVIKGKGNDIYLVRNKKVVIRVSYDKVGFGISDSQNFRLILLLQEKDYYNLLQG